MTRRAPDLNIHWLLDPAADDTASAVPAVAQRQDFPLPEEIGHCWFDRLPLADGITVFHSVHRFRPEVAGQLVALGEFEMVFPEPVFGAQVVKGGTICHREFHPAVELLYRPGQDFFRHADRFHTIPLVEASSDSEMTSLIISDSALMELTGEDIAGQIIGRLGLATPPTAKVMALPSHISAPLHATVSPPLQGRLKILFAQSKVLEYLCGLAVHTGGQAVVASRPGNRREKMRALHDHLMALEGKLPSLEELALRYGMSARWLNDEFAREYGQPIYAFVTDRRLCEAHAALIEGDLPIKAISHRLGYTHVNHFSTAFKRRFGYPPGSLRRSRGQ